IQHFPPLSRVFARTGRTFPELKSKNVHKNTIARAEKGADHPCRMPYSSRKKSIQQGKTLVFMKIHASPDRI
ncbi:MAG: hypothetical protein ACRC8D_05325, partial [Aeromonas sp.]